jgi:hypothetical protein
MMTFYSHEVKTAEQLHDLLMDLNENGTNPVVVGFDAKDEPFLAYGWAPGGDGWDAGFVVDDTHSDEIEYVDTGRCDECGAFDRRAIEKLNYPVRVIKLAPPKPPAGGALGVPTEIVSLAGYGRR